MEHGILSRLEHGSLPRASRGLHDALWRRDPQAGGIQGGLYPCRAANTGEGGSDLLGVVAVPQRPNLGYKREHYEGDQHPDADPDPFRFRLWSLLACRWRLIAGHQDATK